MIWEKCDSAGTDPRNGMFVAGGTQGRENTFYRLRAPYFARWELNQFTLCALFTRFVNLQNPTSGLVAKDRDGSTTSNHLVRPVGATQPTPDPNPELRGIHIAVNTVSEEKSPPLAATDFNGVFDHSYAHEIGHALIWSHDSGHPAQTPGLISEAWQSSPESLGPVIIQNNEIGLMDLQRRLSTIQ